MEQNSKKIAILGAGITGLTLAIALSEAGHDLTIYDGGGFPAKNASAVAGGMVAPYCEADFIPKTHQRLSETAISRWQDVVKLLGDESLLNVQGSLALAHGSDIHMLKRFIEHLPDGSYQEVQIDGQIEPDLAGRFDKCYLVSDEAHIDPVKMLRKMVEYLYVARSTFKHEYVQEKDVQDEFDLIIDARGMGAENIQKDLRGVKGEILTVRNPEFSLKRPVRLMHPRYPLYIIPRGEHLFTVGATIIESADNKSVSVRSEMELLSALYTLHPSFGDAQIIESTARIRPAYAYNMPEIRTDENIISVNGTFRHGYLFAPILAGAVKDLIAGDHSEALGVLLNEGKDADNAQRVA